MSGPSSCTDAPSAVKLDENRVFIAHQYGSEKYLYGTIVTINGTEMVPTITQLSTVGQSCYLPPSAILLEANKVFIAHSYNSSSRYLYGTIVTIPVVRKWTPTITIKHSIKLMLAPSAILLEPNKGYLLHIHIVVYLIRHHRDHKWYGNGTDNYAIKRSEPSCNQAPSAILLEDNKVFIAHAYGSNY